MSDGYRHAKGEITHAGPHQRRRHLSIGARWHYAGIPDLDRRWTPHRRSRFRETGFVTDPEEASRPDFVQSLGVAMGSGDQPGAVRLDQRLLDREASTEGRLDCERG